MPLLILEARLEARLEFKRPAPAATMPAPAAPAAPAAMMPAALPPALPALPALPAPVPAFALDAIDVACEIGRFSMGTSFWVLVASLRRYANSRPMRPRATTKDTSVATSTVEPADLLRDRSPTSPPVPGAHSKASVSSVIASAQFPPQGAKQFNALRIL